MSVSVKDLGGLKRQLEITVVASEASEAYQKHLSKMAGQVQVAGFRKGKVPVSVVEQRYGSYARQEMLSELIQAHLSKSIEAESLQVAGLPEVDVKDWTKDSDLTFTATFEVYPEIQVQPLTGQALERLTLTISEDDIEQAFANIQKEQTTWDVVDRPCEKGDQVVIDYKGMLEGEAFEGGTAEKQTLELGSQQFIPGFEEQVAGMSVGDQREIPVTFPEAYHSPDLAGKEVVFHIVLHEVKAATLPEIDDALADKMQVEGGLSGLREKVKDALIEQGESQLATYMKKQVFDALCEKNEIDVPAALVEQEMKALQDRQKEQMARYYPADQMKDVDLPDEPFRTQAKMRVMMGLLMSEVIRAHDLKAADEEVNAKIEELIVNMPESTQARRWYQTNQEARAQVESLVLEGHVFDTLVAQMDVSEKAVDFAALMSQVQASNKQQENAS